MYIYRARESGVGFLMSRISRPKAKARATAAASEACSEVDDSEEESVEFEDHQEKKKKVNAGLASSFTSSMAL